MENSYFGKNHLIFGLFIGLGMSLSMDACLGRALVPVMRVGSRNTTTLQERLAAAEKLQASLNWYRKYEQLSSKKLEAEADKIWSLLCPRPSFLNLNLFKKMETGGSSIDQALINHDQRQMYRELDAIYKLLDEKAKIESVNVAQNASVEQRIPYVNIDPMVDGYQEIAKRAFAQKKIAFENFKATLIAFATLGTWLTIEENFRHRVISEIAHQRPVD